MTQHRFGRIIRRGSGVPSKSGGILTVLLQLRRRELAAFLGDNPTLRLYRISGVSKGGIGAREFHRKRSEILMIQKGKFRLHLEDLRRRRRTVVLRDDETYGVIKPLVLHTYEALTDDACLITMANTFYDRDRPATYDSYPEREFRELQKTLLSRDSMKHAKRESLRYSASRFSLFKI